METHDLNTDVLRLRIRVIEDGEEYEPMILVPSQRMARLISRSIASAIPNLACAEEADEARGMVAFIDNFLEEQARLSAA